MIKRSIQEEDIIFTNINALNTGALKYIKQILSHTYTHSYHLFFIHLLMDTEFASISWQL